MRRALLTVAALCLILPTSAHGVQVISERSEYQQWADGSLVPTPRGSIRVLNNECQVGPYETAGCAVGRTIYSVLRGGPDLFLHELGHVFDNYEMDHADRSRFATIHGKTLAWGEGDFPLAEQFAEDYRRCAARGDCSREVRDVIDRAWRVMPRHPKGSRIRPGVQAHAPTLRRTIRSLRRENRRLRSKIQRLERRRER